MSRVLEFKSYGVWSQSATNYLYNYSHLGYSNGIFFSPTEIWIAHTIYYAPPIFEVGL